MKTFDAIVIGAGNGGLTAAATLQRSGKKTLLLERHNIPGGCATSFVRDDYEFEVALHQLSGMGSENEPFMVRQLFEDLGVMDRVEAFEEEDLFRIVIPGKVDITLPACWNGLKDVLTKNFPAETHGIEKFLNLCMTIGLEKFGTFPELHQAGDVEAVKEKCPHYTKYGLKTFKQVLEEYIEDPHLRAIFGGYWSYLGLPPSELPFTDLGVMFFVYAAFKPYHFKGGSQSVSNALLDSFLKAGGQARFNCGAKKIITNNGAVVAVVTEKDEHITCKSVVSNASSIVTYNELLDVAPLNESVHTEFKSRRIGTSGFIVYLGLDCAPEDIGVTTASNFISTTLNEDEARERGRTLDNPLFALLTCYNVTDASFAPEGKSQVALMGLQYGTAWDDVSPEEYARTKYAYAEKLLDLAETTFPNIRKHIEVAEVATPRTLQRYLNTPQGAIYGFEQNVLDSSPVLDKPNAGINGLHLASAWIGMGGFQPTYLAGARAAQAIIKESANETSKENTHV